MGNDAEYILSGLRREFESLSNDVFGLRNDVYFLTEQLKKEVSFSNKLISIIRSSGPSDMTTKLLDDLVFEFRGRINPE